MEAKKRREALKERIASKSAELAEEMKGLEQDVTELENKLEKSRQ